MGHMQRKDSAETVASSFLIELEKKCDYIKTIYSPWNIRRVYMYLAACQGKVIFLSFLFFFFFLLGTMHVFNFCFFNSVLSKSIVFFFFPTLSSLSWMFSIFKFDILQKGEFFCRGGWKC